MIVRYPLLDPRGRLVATHARQLDANGRKVRVWWERDGSPGLHGIRTEDLPLYGAQLAHRWDRERPIIVAEGEPAAQALLGAGWQAVGTVTGAEGCPSSESLSVLDDCHVILWPDADEAGTRHMQRIAARLDGIATSARLLSWLDAPPGGDAADALSAGVSVGELLASARSVEPLPQPAPRRAARPRSTPAPADSPIARFKAAWTVSAVLAGRWGVVNAAPGRNVRCPAHEDRSPSLSIARDDGRVWCHAPGCLLANDGRGRDAWDLERLAGGTA